MIQSFGPIADELQVDGDGWVPLNCSSNGNDDGTTIDRHKERNREHAKRTRLRKKELTEAMKLKLHDLQREAADLQQLLQENATANILIGLGEERGSGSIQSFDSRDSLLPYANIPAENIFNHLKIKVREEVAKKRQRIDVPQMDIDQKYVNLSSINGFDRLSQCSESIDSNSNRTSKTSSETNNSHDNENSNFANDSSSTENGSNDRDDRENLVDWSKQGSDADATVTVMGSEIDKKSRNRIHAKQTRDRKKLLTSGMQKLILSLEHHNKLMRSKLSALILRGESTLGQVSINSVPIPR